MRTAHSSYVRDRRQQRQQADRETGALKLTLTRDWRTIDTKPQQRPTLFSTLLSFIHWLLGGNQNTLHARLYLSALVVQLIAVDEVLRRDVLAIRFSYCYFYSVRMRVSVV